MCPGTLDRPCMDEYLRTIERAHGVFLTREVRELGYDDRAIRRALRSGHWHRVRHGAYCFADSWVAASAERRHLVLAKAVVRVTPGPVALSHVTSLVAHELPVWGVDLTSVHVTRLDGGGGWRRSDAVHHEGSLARDDVVQMGGYAMTPPARALVEAGTSMSIEALLVSGDAALGRHLVTPEDLDREHAGVRRWPGAQPLQLAVRLMDGRAASPGESRSRFLFWSFGLPPPELQHEVRDESGALVATTDFAWPDLGAIGEFDGRIKYGRLLRPGQEPGDAVFAEKVREDRIREVTGWTVIRLVWADLSTPRQTAERVARQLGLVTGDLPLRRVPVRRP